MRCSNHTAPRGGLAVRFMEFDGGVYDKESVTMEALDEMTRFPLTERDTSVFLSGRV